jgi:hypothetical protein
MTSPWVTWTTSAGAAVSSLAATAALIFSAETVEASRDQLAVSERGQITDRFDRAVTSVGSPSQNVRLGGIWSLDRIAQDSPADRPYIIEVLAGMVRNNSDFQRRHGPGTPQPLNQIASTACPPNLNDRAADIETAIIVISRYNQPLGPERRIDLTNACLGGLRLNGVNLSNTVLAGADFSQADLSRARLDNADLSQAMFTDTILNGTSCTGAIARPSQCRKAIP